MKLMALFLTTVNNLATERLIVRYDAEPQLSDDRIVLEVPKLLDSLMGSRLRCDLMLLWMWILPITN